MALNERELVGKFHNDVKHRAASLRQLSFWLLELLGSENVVKQYIHDKYVLFVLSEVTWGQLFSRSRVSP